MDGKSTCTLAKIAANLADGAVVHVIDSKAGYAVSGFASGLAEPAPYYSARACILGMRWWCEPAVDLGPRICRECFNSVGPAGDELTGVCGECLPRLQRMSPAVLKYVTSHWAPR